MSRQVNAHQFALLVQPFQVAPHRHLLRHWGVAHCHVHAAKERCLRLELILLIAVPVAHHHVQERFASLSSRGEERFACHLLEAVESPRHNQVLYILFVALRQIHPLEEVKARLVGSILLTLLNHGLHCRFSHPFDSTHAKADVAFEVYRKLMARLVHIGTQRVDAHRLTFIHQFPDFRNVVKRSAHHCRHKLSREISFQKGRLVGHPRIACGMRLVEGV